MADAAGEGVKRPADRAGAGRRLTAVVMGSLAAGFGAAAPWLVPDSCRWAGWACLALFVPVGCGLAFVGVRGRAADLRELSVRDVARDFTGELVGVVVAALLLGLLAALW